MKVEPVPGAPAATAPFDDDRALLVADYHAGIEAALRYERGVELPSAAGGRRERLLDLLARTGADRVVVLGDLGHQIGSAEGAEAEEIADLLDALDVPLTLVQGNHDGRAAETYDERLDVRPVRGVRVGDLGLLHGHTWPAPEVLGATVVCAGHEHVAVRLRDEVGGVRVERAWLRGSLDRQVLACGLDIDPEDLPWGEPDLVVFPAFNERAGGTFVNVEGQGFLSPYLPEALVDGEVYLLDGTRLGDYRGV